MMAKNQDELFEPTPLEKKLEKEKNPMCRACGYFDEKTTCKKCDSLIKVNYHSKNYYKCRFRGVTKGAGTDHRLSYLACKKYKEVSCLVCWDERVVFSHWDHATSIMASKIMAPCECQEGGK